MDKLLGLGIIITAKNMASGVLKLTTKEVTNIGKSADFAKAKLTALATASYALGKTLSNNILGTYKHYEDVARAQGEIASLGIDESGIKKITKAALEFSSTWASTTAPQFIKASYDIKSGISSLSDAAVGEFTKMAALTATATKSSVEEMTKLYALGYGIFRKQFGSDIEFGQKFSAAISSAVKAFRTDGSDLVQGLSNIGAAAASMGVKLEEELAVIGVAKGAFDSATEAGTAYRAFLSNVGKAQEKLGLQFTDANGKMLPMAEILQQIKDKYGDLSDVNVKDEIQQAFGSEEAYKIISALIDKTDDLKKSQSELAKNMEGGLKVTKEMAKAMQRGRAFELLNQQISNLGVVLGEAFAPAVEWVTQKTSALVGWIDSLSAENKEILGYVALGISAFAGIATVLGGVGIVVSGLTALMPALGTAFTVATGPIGIAIAAIATGAILIYKNWDSIKSFFVNLWNGIVDTFNTVKDYLIGIVEFIAAPYIKLFDWIGSKLDWVGSVAKGIADFFGFGGDEKRTPVTKPAKQIKPAEDFYIKTKNRLMERERKRDIQRASHNYSININVNGTNAKPEEIARAVQKAIAKTKDRKFEDDE